VPDLHAELALALARRAERGEPGGTRDRVLARGAEWSVTDVVCTSGPGDRPFEERHERVGIALVLAGSFRYRSASGRGLLAPGGVLLGNAGQCYECGHEHAAGDRCLAFQLAPELFERVASEVGARASERRFRLPHLPPLRALAPLAMRCATALAAGAPIDWEATALEVAARAVTLTAGLPDGGRRPPPPGLEAAVARAVRRIEREPEGEHTLAGLAAAAGASRYHFLRAFERATGTTPHQLVLRARLRSAALALAAGRARVLDVAYDAGFGDLSNFNRAFRAELGASPTAFRRALAAQRETGGTIPSSRA